jgi:hypothetical protein
MLEAMATDAVHSMQERWERERGEWDAAETRDEKKAGGSWHKY